MAIDLIVRPAQKAGVHLPGGGMAMSIEQIREAAFALPREARIELADSLYMSLNDGKLPDFMLGDLEAELHRRSEEIESGKVQTIPWEDIKAEWERDR
jgi:putative addiction module component (TIGR02574 family)